jgi:glycosyltransferase involved in cell wall biosynthesis
MSLTRHKPGSLVCTINYPANSGYAWAFIERLCGQLADEMRRADITTYVAYPAISATPAELVGTAAIPVVLDIGANGLLGVWRLFRGIRRLDARAVYVSDREAYSWRYLLLRLAGVRWLVVHVHATGAARTPAGLKRRLKALRARIGWLGPDVLITVSDFVAERAASGALVPTERIARVWNGIPPADPDLDARNRFEVRKELSLGERDIVIFMASRAAKEKGVDILLRAFDDVVGRVEPALAERIRLVFVGGGVDFDEIASLKTTLRSSPQVILTGPKEDSRRYLSAADIAAMPSVCLDALPLGVLEAMAHGKPVVASAIGGIPEMVRDGREGILVPSGNQAALVEALTRLVENAELRRSLGESAVARARNEFAPEQMIKAIAGQIRRGWQNDSTTAPDRLAEGQEPRVGSVSS